mmetsp:Transcript_46638/g.101273  ORF Transcript_46638/g.101273 Transcript_46638/m.101273 type:complete len:345 (+) Transcript_46638:35-1069(+)
MIEEKAGGYAYLWGMTPYFSQFVGENVIQRIFNLLLLFGLLGSPLGTALLIRRGHVVFRVQRCTFLLLGILLSAHSWEVAHAGELTRLEPVPTFNLRRWKELIIERHFGGGVLLLGNVGPTEELVCGHSGARGEYLGEFIERPFVGSNKFLRLISLGEKEHTGIRSVLVVRERWWDVVGRGVEGGDKQRRSQLLGARGEIHEVFQEFFRSGLGVPRLNQHEEGTTGGGGEAFEIVPDNGLDGIVVFFQRHGGLSRNLLFSSSESLDEILDTLGCHGVETLLLDGVSFRFRRHVDRETGDGDSRQLARVQPNLFQSHGVIVVLVHKGDLSPQLPRQGFDVFSELS